MGLLYDREETERQIVICFKRAAWFYTTVWPLLAIMLVSAALSRHSGWFGLIVLAVIVWVLIWAISFYRPVIEIKRAQKKGPVQSSGSKYSLSSPRTYVINKQEAQPL